MPRAWPSRSPAPPPCPIGQHVLDDRPGRDQDRAGLAHRVTALVVEVGAVLDGPHAGPQGRHDARLAVAVRRDHPVREPGDLHDGPQFRRRELLVDRVIDLGEHAPGRAHLDQLRVAPQLLADRPGALVRPVRQPHQALPPGVVPHPVEREGVQVGMAAGGAQDRPRAVYRRPVDQPLGDRAGQVDAEAAHVAYRGDPRVERGPQIPRAPGGPQRLGLERELRQVKGPGPEEMPVALPHPRHDRRHPGHRRSGSGRRRPGRAGVADPGSVQNDHPVANGPAVPGYEQLSLDSVHHSPRWTELQTSNLEEPSQI